MAEPRPHSDKNRRPASAPALTRFLRRHRLPLAIALAVLAGLSIGYAITRESVSEISYGQFKKKLAADEVLRVKLTPNQVSGEFKPRSPGARAEKFRASTVGMDRDEQLYRLLDEHVPDGNYQADMGTSIVQSALVPTLFLVGLAAGFWLVV